MGSRWLLFVLLLGIHFSHHAYGVDAWSLVDIESSAQLDRAERLAIARDLGARLAVLRNVIPLQTPRAREKVVERLERIDGESLGSTSRGRFFLSRDYQHYQLLELLDEAEAKLDCILQTEDAAHEMLCWAELASVYLSEERIELGLSTLRRSRQVPRDDDMPRVAQDPRVWYTEFGRGILRGIVTPHLSRSIQPAPGGQREP